ncbi:hypothetical protein GCM10018781_74040 [Kitasatospora indigofera]|uniref:Gram-positive cocci surface proteins LPxTG domain-containing protein n=1 Tax=Kitasatospora indigofera TaxID=67307 RepID=A0A919L579_9ACTN|nr:hypothetical protein [Kitasatospora indigofera]GHH84553.1 hypothetical protein GCM10018781_74040 [Kitasatospora indigofera]
MRASGISAFTKNVPSLSRRSRATGLAAALLLAGAVQVLPGNTAWACGGPDSAQAAARAADPAVAADNSFELHGRSAEVAFVGPAPAALVAGGPAIEFGIEIANSTEADYRRIAPGLGFFNAAGATPRPSQVTVEVMAQGRWKRLAMKPGCDPAIHSDPAGPGEPLAVGRAVRYTFRVTLAADAPKDLARLQMYAGANFGSATADLKVTRPVKAAAPGSGAPAAKAGSAPGGRPGAEAAGPAVEPAAGRAPVTGAGTTAGTAAPAAPTAPTAGTAPADAPATELARTGASSPNGFLAGSAAAFVALGAGVLIAVRRLRNQG